MKKPIFNKTGMRVINFESAHKTFNSKIMLPTRGNVLDPGYKSNYIRGNSETECNGYQFKPGELQDFDFHLFVNYKIPNSVRAVLHTHGGVLVCLWFWERPRKPKARVLGWIAFDKDQSKVLLTVCCGGYKAQSVIDEFIKFIL